MTPLIRLTLVVAAFFTGLSLNPVAPSEVRADRLVLVAGGDEAIEKQVPAIRAKLKSPFGVDFNRENEMFIVELEGGRVHHVDSQNSLRRIGGTGEMGDSGDGGPAVVAVFHSMHTVVLDQRGRLFIADTHNHRVRILDPKTGKVEPFAGTGKKGAGGIGQPAQKTEFDGVYCVAFTPDYKQLLVTDLENKRIVAIDMKTETSRLIAGNGTKGVPKDGSLATEAPLVDPRAAIADREGNVYVLERSGHALRVVNPQGQIFTLAGTGVAGNSGDNGPALAATLRGPKHLCLDRDGNVIIADTDNHIIRKYDRTTKRIERVAGTGKKGTAGLGGPPTQAELNWPHGVCFDPDGVLHIVDTGNNRILKLVRE